MGYAKLFEMVYACLVAEDRACLRLGKGKEFSLMHYSRGRMHAEIAVVHFVNHRVGYRFQLGAAVRVPARRICTGEIYYGSTLAISAHGFGPHARGFCKLPAANGDTECVKFAI